jgi:hypothetical protein
VTTGLPSAVHSIARSPRRCRAAAGPAVWSTGRTPCRRGRGRPGVGGRRSYPGCRPRLPGCRSSGCRSPGCRLGGCRSPRAQGRRRRARRCRRRRRRRGTIGSKPTRSWRRHVTAPAVPCLCPCPGWVGVWDGRQPGTLDQASHSNWSK